MSGLLMGAAMALVAASCTGGPSADDGVLSIYTSVTQETVDAVVEGFEQESPGTEVEVFRAPTGEVAARIASELRGDGLQADVLWLTDPLSIQQYELDGLLQGWSPENVEVVPDEFRTDSFFGTRILNLVIVASDSLDDPPSDWPDLPRVQGEVALPDPGFAGSAFGALGFFALDPEYGMGYYEDLREFGAVQVRSPGDVVSGVAEGLYAAGITLDLTARNAVQDGSPLRLIWPESGAISMYSPIAVVEGSDTADAESFVEYVLGAEAQAAVAGTGWEPIRDDVEWPDFGAQRTVDWSEAFDRQQELLSQYQDAFGQ